MSCAPTAASPSSDGARTAVERSDARSDPASGSDHTCAQICSAEAIAGRKRAFCASVPWSSIEGASRLIPFCDTRPGAPADQYSSSKTSHSVIDAPRPPYSVGHDTTE